MARYFKVMLAVSWVFLASAVFAQRAPTTQQNDDAFKAKGLIKFGSFYLLPVDARIQDELKTVRQLQARVQQVAKRRQTFQRNIDGAMQQAQQMIQQNRNLDSQLKSVPKTEVDRYNGMVNEINSLAAQIPRVFKYAEDQQKEMAKLIDPRDEYIAALIGLSGKMEDAAKQYETLAADEDLKSTLARTNEKSPVKFKLGPSARFTTELANIHKERKLVNSASIKLEMRGVPFVNVTLNGTVTEKMIVDSGASTVLLNYAIADKLGIHPGKESPSAKFTIANGETVEAKLIVVKSVRVAQFTAENVEAAVLPESVKDADCLLGGSFLRNFSYKMDLTAGTLQMTEIRPADAKDVLSADEPAQVTAATDPTAAPTNATAPKTGSASLVLAGPCKIVSKAADSGFCVSVVNRNRGEFAVAATVSDAVEKQFVFEAAGDGIYKITNPNSALALGVGDSSKIADAAVSQTDWRNGSEQLWTIEVVSGRFVKIVNKNSGLCLTIAGNAAAGAKIIQQPWHDSDNQTWRLRPVDD